MAKHNKRRRVNPVVTASILRKGGAHRVSRSGERQRDKQKVKQLGRKIEAGLSGLDAFQGRVLQHSLLMSAFNTHHAHGIV